MSPAAADGVASNRARTVLGVVGAAIVIVLMVVAVNAALPTEDRPLSADERLERVYDRFDGYGWNCYEPKWRPEWTPGEFSCVKAIPETVADFRQCDTTVTADGDVGKVFCTTGSIESGGGGWPP